MAIGYRGAKVAGTAGQGGGSIAINSGLTGGSGSAALAGDLVIVTVAVGTAGRNPDLSIVTPSGYTPLTLQHTTASAIDISVRTCYKIMPATPDTAVTIPASGNNADGIAYTIQVFSGVDPDNPEDVAATYATGSGTDNLPDGNSITPSTAGAVIVVAGGGAAGAGGTFTNSELTDFRTANGQDTNDATVGAGYFAWTSGTFNPAKFGGGNANAANSWGCTTMALRPFNITGTGSPDAQAATVSGSGTSSSSGSGTPAAQSATADGEGIVAWIATGTLAAGSATVDGEGEVTAGGVSGTGVLLASSADVEGAGATSSSGSGALSAQAADVTASGTSTSSGAGALAAQGADVTGAGSSTSTGTGILAAQASDVTALGLSGSSGAGVLASQAAAVDGEGTVSTQPVTGTGALLAGSAAISGVGVVSGAVISTRRPLDGPGARIQYVLEGREALAYYSAEEQQEAISSVLASASFAPVSGFAVVEQISGSETASLAKIERFEVVAKSDSTGFQGLGRTHALATAEDRDLQDFYLLLEAA